MRGGRSVGFVAILAAVFGACQAAPAVATNWDSMPIPFSHGDSWAGGALSDRERLYVVSRELVEGFWGAIRVRTSDDTGLTWSGPGLASRDDTPTAARPTIAVGPDGSVWVAFARQGPQVATQSLEIEVSIDHAATWPAPVRASPASIGLIGLPALLVTPAMRLVAYTDGTSGSVLVQPLGPDARPIGEPSVLGTTTRELYSDAEFLDGGIALAAAGRHVVALWHASDSLLEVSVSEDAGRTWRAVAPLSTRVGWVRPHVIAGGGRFVALVNQTDTVTSRSWLELESSRDGGLTWDKGPRLSDGPTALEGVVSEEGGTWTVAYAACTGLFGCESAPQIWSRSSIDGARWTDPQPLTPPGSYAILGAGAAAGRTWVIWEQQGEVAADNAVQGAIRRPDPGNPYADSAGTPWR